MILLPAELGDATLQIITRLNGGDESIQIIMIALKTDCPPSMVTSIDKDQTKEILQWLVDHHDRARTERHEMPEIKPAN